MAFGSIESMANVCEEVAPIVSSVDHPICLGDVFVQHNATCSQSKPCSVVSKHFTRATFLGHKENEDRVMYHQAGLIIIRLEIRARFSALPHPNKVMIKLFHIAYPCVTCPGLAA